MAIVNQTSDLYRDEYGAGRVLDSAKVRGRSRQATGSVTHAATDSAGSKYLLAELPSGAIMGAATAFDVTSLGFADVRIGTHDDPAALVSQLQSAGNTISPFAQFDANHGKELWEVLGLAANPGGMIRLYFHANANATGAGSLLFELHWLE